jgi:hypothetical protein
LTESNHILHFQKHINGYRYNTDFDNQNFVLKSVFNKLPINDVGCSFGKVWGKWFYASPAAIDQYEETTASLVGFQRLSKKVKFYLEPRYIGDVIKTNMFLSGRIRLFTEFAYQTRLLQIKRIVYIKYWCYRLWCKRLKVFLSVIILEIITVF